MFIASIVGLALFVAGAGTAIFASHIPWLRILTGAAPLLPEEPDAARDFARSVNDGYIETADVWAARLEAADRALEAADKAKETQA